MSRAHCLDCGTDVPVDPLGHCPEGHLLPAQGRRVESAIGSDDYHPDEPEPWVAQVDPPAAPEPDELVPSAQPQAAPGLAPAERETTTGDLLRELGSLSASDAPPSAPDTPPPPSAPDDAGPPSAPSAAAAPPTETPAPPSPAPSSTPPQDTPAVSAGPDLAVSEHSALEQALASLDEAHEAPTAPATTEQPAPAPALDDDLSSLFEELDGIGGDTNGNAPATPATAAPATSQPPTAPPPASGRRPTRQALREAGELAGSPPKTPPGDEYAGNGHDAGATASGLDTMNFTAKGGAMNGRRRRRLLGR